MFNSYTGKTEQIKTLKTYQEKSEALIALVPMLPQSGSLYSEYLQIASFLPEDLKQDAIAALSATLNADEGFLNYSDNYEPVHVHYPKEAMTVISEDGVAIMNFLIISLRLWVVAILTAVHIATAC